MQTEFKHVRFAIVHAEKRLAPFEKACAVGLNHQTDTDFRNVSCDLKRFHKYQIQFASLIKRCPKRRRTVRPSFARRDELNNSVRLE